jgi:hypothetical protein
MRVSPSRIRRVLGVSLTACIVIASAFLQADSCAQQLFCKDQSCAGSSGLPFAYLLSLPVSSPITNETQLLASIPNALYVEKLDESTDHYWRWDGSAPCEVWDHGAGGYLGGTMIGTGKQTGALTCFDVLPGEGYVVVVNQATQYTIQGVDGSTVLTLDAPGATSSSGLNLVSLPFCTNITLASQLFNSIGGKADVARVQRYLCASDTFQSYTGRLTTGPNFPLVPGEDV